MITTAGIIVKGAAVFVRKSNDKLKAKEIKNFLFSDAYNAKRIVSTKNIVKIASKFPDLALKTNQGDEDKASAAKTPVNLLKSFFPRKNTKTKVKIPEIAWAALAEKSLIPKSL